MLGRVRRQSMRSLEELEMEERYSSKIIKHDSLSIYEATLMKLKEGSRRDLIHLHDGSSRIASDSVEQREEITTDAGCSSANASENSRDDQCIGLMKDEKKRNVSVIYMFSKYKNSQQALSSPDLDAMAIDNECSSSSASNSNSPCFDDYQLTGSSKQDLQ